MDSDRQRYRVCVDEEQIRGEASGIDGVVARRLQHVQHLSLVCMCAGDGAARHIVAVRSYAAVSPSFPRLRGGRSRGGRSWAPCPALAVLQ